MSVAVTQPLPALARDARAWVEARKAGLVGPLAPAQRRAAEAFEAAGLPTGREEAWRQTPITALLRAEVAPAAPGRAEPQAGAGFVQGVPVATDLPPGVTRLSETDPAVVEALGSVVDLEHPFAALNGALFQSPLALRVEAGADVSLTLDHRADGGAVHPRLLVLAEPGSRLRLTERFRATGANTLVNPVAEILVSQGAEVDHLRLADDEEGVFHVGALAARVERDGRYTSRSVALGGRLTRLDLDVALVGEGAEARLDGLYLVAGDQVVDHHTRVDHQSPRATSFEAYKGILGGRSRGVFDGAIVVRPGAFKTSGAQENRNLLLSREALVHTQPRLFIDNDDVKASHGATVGQLDATQLFYLRSRGLDEDAARAILVWGFAREVVERIPDEARRHEVGEAVAARLPQGELLRELT